MLLVSAVIEMHLGNVPRVGLGFRVTIKPAATIATSWEIAMSTFNPDTNFERSRKMLAVVLLIQLLVTILLAGSYDEKLAVGLVGAVSLVAVLTKRPWYTENLAGRFVILGLLVVFTVVAGGCGYGMFLAEQADESANDKFWIWLAPLAAAVIAIFDFVSSVLAVHPNLASTAPRIP